MMLGSAKSLLDVVTPIMQEYPFCSFAVIVLATLEVAGRIDPVAHFIPTDFVIENIKDFIENTYYQEYRGSKLDTNYEKVGALFSELDIPRELKQKIAEDFSTITTKKITYAFSKGMKIAELVEKNRDQLAIANNNRGQPPKLCC